MPKMTSEGNREITSDIIENVDPQKDEETEEKVAQKMKELEKEQEAKLRSKYPNLKGPAGPGHSAFLQKRLSKGQKYFDSGDYNMAKAKMGPPSKALPAGGKLLLPGPTGEAIPTPQDLPPRKPSIIQSKLASGSLS